MRKKSTYESFEPPSPEACHSQRGIIRAFRSPFGYEETCNRALEAERAPALIEDYYDSLVWGVFPEDCDC